MSFGNFGASNTGLFGAAKPAGGSLFGAPSATPPVAAGGTSGATAPTGSIFGSSSATGTSAPTTSLFGGGSTSSTTTPGATNIFGNKSGTSIPAAPATGGLFGAKPADAPAAAAPSFGGLFGKPAEKNDVSTSAAPAAPSFGGLFGKPAEKSDASASSAPAAPSLGGLFGKPAEKSDVSTSAAPAAPPLGGLFGKPAEKKDGSTPAAGPAPLFGAATPVASNPPPAGSLFGAKPADATAPAAPSLGGLFGKPAEKKDDSAPVASVSSFGATTSTAASGTTASSTGLAVAVAPPSTLKGKTIEEIVNKWSTDLETHVREFNKFAGEVAVWDRALIENSNTLSALYGHVEAAEREQSDIDQSLDHIEQQQTELASTLVAYEKVAQEILGSQGGGMRALDTGPADTERDKNYMLATDLHTHLDDLSGSLTQMIDSVNALSLPSIDSTPAEDPMAQIAQILSSHLESLQWIDGAVRDVEGKITEVEQRVKDNGHTLPSSGQKTNRTFGPNR
ncbi:hypothetical protein C0991_006597 [Blastosporella zonata]|nr:hypothetical protein C0991_006597 [Blastosporella zonata]